MELTGPAESAESTGGLSGAPARLAICIFIKRVGGMDVYLKKVSELAGLSELVIADKAIAF